MQVYRPIALVIYVTLVFDLSTVEKFTKKWKIKKFPKQMFLFQVQKLPSGNGILFRSKLFLNTSLQKAFSVKC